MWYASIKHTITIFRKYLIIFSMTCPKSWGNGPQRPKILKTDHFLPFSNHVLALLHANMDHKAKWKQLGTQSPVTLLWFHANLLKPLLILSKNLGKKTQTAKNTKNLPFLLLLPTSSPPKKNKNNEACSYKTHAIGFYEKQYNLRLELPKILRKRATIAKHN